MKNVITVLTAVIGIAILAIVISDRANTVNVIKSLTDGFSNLIKTALSATK